MGDVIEFRRPKPKSRGALCREGLHKWVVVQERPFDVHSGKLITTYKCAHCGRIKTETR